MPNQNDCPGPEFIAALIDGRLPAAEAARVREHVAECPTCFELTRETIHYLSSETAGKGEGFVSSFPGFVRAIAWWGVAAAVLVVAGLQVARYGREDGVASLVKAVGERRLVEARLSGGFAYAPLPSAERGPAPLDRALPGDWKVFEAAGRIYDASERSRHDPKAMH